MNKIEKQSIIDAYVNILNNYFSNFMESEICCQEQNYYINTNFNSKINYNLFIGLKIINRIFECVLLKTKNVSSTYYYTNESITYYLEYLEQIYKANYSNNVNTDIILFVYKKIILELFDNDSKNNNIKIGGKSILSNIIQSNSNFNNLEDIPKQELILFCSLLFKITNLLLSWKNTIEVMEKNDIIKNKLSYILRIESCVKLLDSFMKNVDNISCFIEYLEIFYQQINISHSMWINFLEEFLLEISKKRKKKEFKDTESFLLFFNIEKENIQDNINNNKLAFVIHQMIGN